MKESLTPEKIEKDFLMGILSKENTLELLNSLIESSDNTGIRVESIKLLEKIGTHDEKIFKTLENQLISDENAFIRASVANYIIYNFLEEGIPALRWIIQNEKSPLVLKIVFNSLNRFKNPQLNLIKKDLINWNKNYASKIGINPQEAIFFFDLESLFAKDKQNYEINPLWFKNFQKLSNVKNGEPWLVIKNKHVEILNFNFFKWKFIKDNLDLVNTLSKLQDLDLYLNLLKRYDNNAFELSEIPESIGYLTYIKKLILRNNNLTKLPFSFKKLNFIEELDLSYNKFKQIPKVLNSNKTLKIINIKHNLVQNIPESLIYNVKIIR